jgi:hypothetical protein
MQRFGRISSDKRRSVYSLGTLCLKSGTDPALIQRAAVDVGTPHPESRFPVLSHLVPRSCDRARRSFGRRIGRRGQHVLQVYHRDASAQYLNLAQK